MKFNKTAIRSISATLVLAQLSLAMQPLMAAMREDKGASSPMAQAQLKQMQALQRSMDEARASKAQAAQSPADRASAQLARIEELVRDLDDLRGQLSGEPPAGSSTREQERAIGPMMKVKVRPLTADQKTQLQNRRDALWNELRGLLAKQADDQAAVRAEFAQNRQMLIDRKLPQVIMQRHDDAVRDFEQRVAQFNRSLSSLSANPEAAAAEMKDFFDQYPTTRRAAPVDPKNLPWRTPEPTKRMPAETQTAWFQNLYGREGTRLAQTGNNLDGLTFITPPEPGTAPTAADLAETPETQRTPAIVAKAKELGNNPVNIQNWVRNNVEWVPTWGAIQSAQDTLDKKRGNAIDIASLQIALLRAAKIPARYQFGTVELPAAQVMNWVGGVSKPEAAQQLLGQGGIANRGLIEGGKISKIRMEHAWVQAYVNWVPSRGAKQGSAVQHPNLLGQRNAWVPLDGAFKQYQYSAGKNLSKDVPLDTEALLADARSGATVNESEGWVQNIPQNGVQDRLADFQNRLTAYIASNSTGAGAAYGEVLGRKVIPQERLDFVSGYLSAPVILLGAQVASLPQGLQHRFVFRLDAAGIYGGQGENYLTFTGNVSQIAGKRLMLNYVPATAADADLIASYLPAPNSDGSPIKPEQLPKGLPGYLVRLSPQLTLDGQVVAASSLTIGLGAELTSVGGFTRMNDLNQWDLTQDESHIAGQATAIGLSAGGIGVAQIERLKASLASTKDSLQSASPVAIGGLSGERLSDDLLTATIWGWFAAVEVRNRIAQGPAQVVDLPALSYGLFHAAAQPVLGWGVIRQVKFPGVNLDVGHVRMVSWAKDNDRLKWVGYNRASGQYMSALEHIIPERYFNNTNLCAVEGSLGGVSDLPACPKGVSAVQAIGVATQVGQRVYTITRDVFAANPNIVSTALSAHSSGTRSAVQNALSGGMEVVVHERPVTISGWSGAGYITIDPATGAGGYIIEGGSNGGWLSLLVDAFAALLAIVGMVKGLSLAGRALGYLFVSAAVASPISLALAGLTLLAALAGGTEGGSAAAKDVATIVGLTQIGILLQVGAAVTGGVGLGILAALALTVLLVYVANLARQLVLISIAGYGGRNEKLA